LCGSKQKYIGEHGKAIKNLCDYAAHNCIQLEHSRWYHSPPEDRDDEMFCRFCKLCVEGFQLQPFDDEPVDNDKTVDNDESAGKDESVDNDESMFTSKEGACLFPQLWTEITDWKAEAKFLPPEFNADDEKHENPNPIFPGICDYSGDPGQPEWLEVACPYANKCKVTHELVEKERPKFIQRMASPGAEDAIQMEEGCQFKELWAAVLTTDHCTDEPPHGKKRLHCQYAGMCLGKNDKSEGEKSTS
jgi:hypothetical protein